MSSHMLSGCRVLVVEDEYFLAEDLRSALEGQEAIVLGPLGQLTRAIQFIQSEADIDAAVLDVNLGGELVYPAADLLLERNVPVVFTTGYDGSAIPPRYADSPRFEKPVDVEEVAKAIGRLIKR